MNQNPDQGTTLAQTKTRRSPDGLHQWWCTTVLTAASTHLGADTAPLECNCKPRRLDAPTRTHAGGLAHAHVCICVCTLATAARTETLSHLRPVAPTKSLLALARHTLRAEHHSSRQGCTSKKPPAQVLLDTTPQHTCACVHGGRCT
jgi:hypothetical protein